MHWMEVSALQNVQQEDNRKMKREISNEKHRIGMRKKEREGREATINQIDSVCFKDSPRRERGKIVAEAEE